MISCIAIDDEPLALELLETYCSQVPYLELKKTFTKTSEAIQYLRKFPVDLLFLDIQMPDISGIAFYKSLKEAKMVIFTTAYSEYAVEGFNLNAVDYLLKPITFKRFEQAVIKTKEYFEYLNNKNSGHEQFLFVRSEYRLVKIPLAEIIYIEGLGDYVKIFTGPGKPVISHISMKAISEKLPSSRFIRVHRSFIIPKNKEISIRNKLIQIGNVKIPLGISYEKEVMKIFGKS